MKPSFRTFATCLWTALGQSGNRYRTALVLAAFGSCLMGGHAQGQTPLADQPLFSANPVPGNLALALSVEYPTAVSVAHIGNYSNTRTYPSPSIVPYPYLGYFDSEKCYTYLSIATDSTVGAPSATAQSYFFPDGLAVANHTCSGKWSGNFLNWATMQTIDPFRWALTGGYRVLDTASLTVVEKAWASGQGGTGNFPNRSITGTMVAGATPLSALGTVNLRVQGLGNKLRFSSNAANLDNGTATVHYANAAPTADTVYEVFVRAAVCDKSGGAGGLESNCIAYGSNYKPEGLIQKYAHKIRFSAFGYLNDANIQRDAGVLRARQKYVGPTKPVPGSVAIANTASEWDAATGVFIGNPDSTDASTTATLFGVTVADSGVMNYLNKFGRFSGNYKTYDPVSELYYAAVRYFKNLGNVPEWTSIPAGTSTGTKTTWVDGFPVIATWDDPILYSCQRNFILGIGDVNTHADANVPGAGTPTGNEPTKPPAVVSDTSVDAVVATNKVGSLQGLGGSLGTTNPYGGCCNNNTALMAGLAYDANTRDIRPDDSSKPNTLGMQTISTYWLDVMEFQTFKSNNQFLLAAKYGGFAVPTGYDPYAQTTALPQSWWSTTGDLLPDGTPRPDNFFTAGAPDKMIAGLNTAFADIASKIRAYTTSFSTSLPQVAQLGNGSYSTLYDSSSWTGEIIGSNLSFDAALNPVLIQQWKFTDLLGVQAASNGWDTKRRIATWNTSTKTAAAFRTSGISSSQLSALDTSYRSGVDGSDYLNYLRGDQSQEGASVVVGSSHAYRTRVKLLGDIVGSKAEPVGPPALPLSDTLNPGYSTFQSLWATRRTVVYVGANDGMLHAINGALQTTNVTAGLETDTNAGTEMFAYVPGALYAGPNNTPGTDGLAAIGNPVYAHKYFVNASPTTFDIDFGRTPDNTGAAQALSPDWRTVLVGGLGKGGKSYYAIDVTDPVGMVTGGESAVVSKVLWEFSDPDMGYTYDSPAIAKTKKYGWVFVFPSGYNNANGQGYFFIVNPRNGALLEKISTGVGSPAASAGLAHVNGYVYYYPDGTMDSVYAGDLLGNLWRLDLTATTGAYPAPVKIATLTDSSGTPQPITTRPLIEYHPVLKKRFVLVGTGRLLDTTDIASSQMQSFYAIQDGGGGSGQFNASTGLPSGITFPVPRAKLAQVTDPLVGMTFDPLTQMGWYMDLGVDTASNISWRITNRPTSFNGSVSFVASLLSADVCSPAGISRIYGLDFANGTTLLKTDSSANSPFIPFLKVSANVTDLKDLSVGGQHARIYGDDKGGLGQAPGKEVPGATGRRLNWREIPVVD